MRKRVRLKPKITEGSVILNNRDALSCLKRFEDAYKKGWKVGFRKKIIEKLCEIVTIKEYRNKVGIEILGELLEEEVVIEWKAASESDGRKIYYVVQFKNKTYACTCPKFIMLGNVMRPKVYCKHIKDIKNHAIKKKAKKKRT